MQNKASAKEYVMCNLILAVLGAVIIFAGICEIALFVLIPAVLTYMFVRFDLKRMILPIILIVLTSSLVSGGINITPLIIALPMAVMLAYAIKRKHGLLKTVCFGTIGEMLSAILTLFVFHMMSGAQEGGGALAYLGTLAQQAIEEAGELYGLMPEYEAMLSEMFNVLLPSVLMCAMASLSYLVFYICVWCLKKRDNSYVGVYRPFSEIKADKACVLAIAVFFMASMVLDGIVAKTLVNIVVILMFFMFVCGLSSMVFVIKRVRSRIGKICAYILLIVSAFTTSSMFIFIALIDAFADFRRLEKRS